MMHHISAQTPLLSFLHSLFPASTMNCSDDGAILSPVGGWCYVGVGDCTDAFILSMGSQKKIFIAKNLKIFVTPSVLKLQI